MIQSRALTPDTDLLALHRQAPSRYPMLLESVASGTTQGRWDLLLAADGSGLRLDAHGRTHTLDGHPVAGDFLDALDAEWQVQRVAREEPRWPFRGGWALLLNYELAGQVEPVLALPRCDDAIPVALALRCPAAILRDRTSGDCVAL
ncbi:MAG TPA: aminodeoxychorismate synthase, component I, partial [Pseudoxanthomonas sp.]|nr:aminodeoxychorismate synthase, component I [Pseudoxanthomonas sp.]